MPSVANQNRDTAARQHLVGFAAKQKPVKSGVPGRTHHNQIAQLHFGRTDNGHVRAPVKRIAALTNDAASLCHGLDVSQMMLGACNGAFL